MLSAVSPKPEKKCTLIHIHDESKYDGFIPTVKNRIRQFKLIEDHLKTKLNEKNKDNAKSEKETDTSKQINKGPSQASS